MESGTSSGRTDVRQRVLHALDLGMLGDWEGAKRSLEHLDDPIVPRLMALMTEQQRREKERGDAQAIARHELGNAISVAQANIEAMVDGVLEPTIDRLAAIRDALQTSGTLLDDLKKQYRPRGETRIRIETFDICDLIGSQVEMIASIAEAKNVRLRYAAADPISGEAKIAYRGDPDRVAYAIRHMLLSAVRYTPPGGLISVDCIRPSAEVMLSVEGGTNGSVAHDGIVGLSLPSKLLEAIGGQARIVHETPQGAKFMLALPAIPTT